MKCRKCGAELLVTDTFCVKCGHKIEPNCCPACGEALREGPKFCHRCGAPVAIEELEDDAIPLVQQKTVDIPFEQIEQGILYEADKVAKEPPRNLYHQPVVDKETYAELEEDREGDIDLDIEEEEESSLVTRLSIFMAIAIGIILLVLGFIYLKRNHIWDRGEPETQGMEQEESAELQSDGEQQEDSYQGKIRVITNVNVRDNPSKEQSKVLFVAKSGEEYDYYEKDSNGWYHIKLEEDNADGYVYEDYVEVFE